MALLNWPAAASGQALVGETLNPKNPGGTALRLVAVNQMSTCRSHGMYQRARLLSCQCRGTQNPKLTHFQVLRNLARSLLKCAPRR